MKFPLPQNPWVDFDWRDKCPVPLKQNTGADQELCEGFRTLLWKRRFVGLLSLLVILIVLLANLHTEKNNRLPWSSCHSKLRSGFQACILEGQTWTRALIWVEAYWNSHMIKVRAYFVHDRIKTKLFLMVPGVWPTRTRMMTTRTETHLACQSTQPKNSSLTHSGPYPTVYPLVSQGLDWPVWLLMCNFAGQLCNFSTTVHPHPGSQTLLQRWFPEKCAPVFFLYIWIFGENSIFVENCIFMTSEK